MRNLTFAMVIIFSVAIIAGSTITAYASDHYAANLNTDRETYRSDQNITVTWTAGTRDSTSVEFDFTNAGSTSHEKYPNESTAHYTDTTIEGRDRSRSVTIDIDHTLPWKTYGEGLYRVSVQNGPSKYIVITEAPDPLYTAVWRLDATLTEFNLSLIHI